MLPPDFENSRGPDLREDRCHAGRTTSGRPAVTRQASRATKKSLHSLRRLGVALGASTSLAVFAVASAQAVSPPSDGSATSLTPCPVALNASAIAATPAACPPQPPRNLRAEADGIMRMTYDQFADFSRVHLKPFDWSTDGCSGPKFTKRIYKDLFDKPCRLHDFGYRNYGRGLHLGRNETTRAWIDLRFKQEMDRRCNHFTGWQSYKGVVCRGEAHLIYDYERETGNLVSLGVKGFYG
jgi:Prokaryotic phospholipase A2